MLDTSLSITTATASPEDDDTVTKIMSEMGFFASLLLISEFGRRWVKFRHPGSVIAHNLLVCSLVLSWFTVSITLILFNKWVISSGQGGQQMTTPVSYTMSHMAMKGIIACIYFWLTGMQFSLPKVTCRVLIGLTFVGVFAALDIVTSNLSFLYISASFYTFLKASSLIFILVLAMITGLEQASVTLVSTCVLITCGLFLASYGDADFNTVGFALVMVSEAFAALRWITTQIMLESDDCDAMTAVLYMSPGATLSLLPAVMIREREALQALDWTELSTFGVLIIFPGFLAFLLLLVEVHIIKETSSLNMTVFGSLKSAVTVVFCVIVFRERTTLIQWAGLLVALTGMIAYSHSRGEWVDSVKLEKVRSGLLPRLESANDLWERYHDPEPEMVPEMVTGPTERTHLISG
mmetsp:Transcript_90238/g.232950  ORF Transcript_90238/g.232950 Transcript_90238/m.232950 type:complete len:408 (+) Transcript_90238:61-1284(+)